MTTKVEKSIEVGVPVSVAYNQWTQFEEFPQFMGGVQSVTQQGESSLHWVVEIAGVRREWDATILEQVPDEKVAWAAVGGATNAGAVYFAPAGPDRTSVTLHLEYEPEGIVEKAGDALNIVAKQAESDLERFKTFIEERGSATGAWRGGINEDVSVGTPGVEDAALSRGDDGKAGVSGKVLAAGAGLAAAAVAGAAAMTSKGSDESGEVSEGAVPAAGEQDVVDLLVADHREVAALVTEIRTSADPEARRDLADTVITELVRHSVAEEMYVYPAMRKHLADGDASVEHDVEEHKQLEATMKQLEGVPATDPTFDELIARLEGILTDHIADEETDQFPKLRASVPRAELVELAGKVEAAKKLAPTRPHPAAPNSQAFHKLVGPGVGLVDRLRDKLSGRSAG